MNNILTIFKREFSSYFNSPIAYIFIIAILAVCSGFYMFIFFFQAGFAEMRDFFSINSWLMLFFLPAITMRLWADEQKSGSIALLQSLPMKPHELVLGKYLAGIGFYVLYLVGTLPIPIAIAFLGRPDFGPVIGGYLGLFFLGSLYTAIGLFFSGLFKDQITSWVMAVIGCLIIHLLGWLPVVAQLDSWVGGFGTFLQRAVGSVTHFENMYKGVISLSDIIYFLSFAAVFVVLNSLTVEQRMRRMADVTFITSAVVMLAVAAMLNIVIFRLPLGRIDTTEGKIYTVSKSARNILKELKTKVTVRYYVTPEEKMPAGMKDIQRNITDKLSEFAHISNKVKFEVIDPTADAEMAKALEDKGIAPFTLRTAEKDAVGIKKVYSSLAISYLDKPDDIIPQVLPQSLPMLEYELCSRIFRMTQPSQPGMALVAPYDPVDPRMQQQMMMMRQQMPEKNDRFKNLAATFRALGYNVSRIDLSSKERMPGDFKTLIVFASDGLGERQRFEIAKALSAGKNVILAAQQYKYNYQHLGGTDVMIMPAPAGAGVNELVSNYGIALGDKILMDEQNQVIGIQTQTRLAGFIPVAVNIDVQSPVQIRVSPENMNSDYAFTSNLGPMIYLWGSSLKIDKTKIGALGLNATTIISSSSRSLELDFTVGPLGDDSYKAASYSGKQPLMVMMTGQFPNPYDNQPPPKWQDEPDSVPASTTPDYYQKAPGKLLIVGCSEIFGDQFIPGAEYEMNRPSHEELLLQAVEGLTLSEDLLHISSKAVQVRYLNETSPLAKVLWRSFTILLSPAIIIAFGVVRMFMRQERRQTYRRMLEQTGSSTSVGGGI
jgi:ABC-type transport system involved in multi-copper enzyme maturation permease subunit